MVAKELSKKNQHLIFSSQFIRRNVPEASKRIISIVLPYNLEMDIFIIAKRRDENIRVTIYTIKIFLKNAT